MVTILLPTILLPTILLPTILPRSTAVDSKVIKIMLSWIVDVL